MNDMCTAIVLGSLGNWGRKRAGSVGPSKASEEEREGGPTGPVAGPEVAVGQGIGREGNEDPGSDSGASLVTVGSQPMGASSEEMVVEGHPEAVERRTAEGKRAPRRKEGEETRGFCGGEPLETVCREVATGLPAYRPTRAPMWGPRPGSASNGPGGTHLCCHAECAEPEVGLEAQSVLTFLEGSVQTSSACRSAACLPLLLWGVGEEVAARPIALEWKQARWELLQVLREHLPLCFSPTTPCCSALWPWGRECRWGGRLEAELQPSGKPGGEEAFRAQYAHWQTQLQGLYGSRAEWWEEVKGRLDTPGSVLCRAREEDHRQPSAEPLAQVLRRDAWISGLGIPGSGGMEARCILYMDDVTVCCTDATAVGRVLDRTEWFGRASGARLNRDKTTLMVYGRWTETDLQDLPLTVTADNVRILGVNFDSEGLGGETGRILKRRSKA
ncbi:hypothetical protein AAFF_G00375910 [Aldrovandia affinis]|uniref:Reverse transcriptase domain-containing protein n=1 Tax=Aldrovandia affinis TaxID=143900 RepID=A0AAD7VYE1_9TELE|nr:hypothetical protein AAFF_G00375910 [Aldrovandia affinis]